MQAKQVLFHHEKFRLGSNVFRLGCFFFAITGDFDDHRRFCVAAV
jgi:hypothetical protein